MDRQLNLYTTALTRRDKVLAEIVLFPFRAVVILIANAYRSWRAAKKRRATIRILDALEDRILQDIGLARHEICDFATKQSAAHPVSSKRPSLVQGAGHAVRAAQRSFKTWHRARSTARELRDLDRRQLADIGLRPRDVYWLAPDLAERSLNSATDRRDRTAA